MVEQLTAEQLRKNLDSGAEMQLIDTRRPEKFADGHIPGARNLPYDELADRIDEMEWGKEIVLVCEIGQSSLQAARILESYEGVDDDALVANLDGGYEDWDGELESGEG
jgi:rhodanese-related sulfurtransferase